MSTALSRTFNCTVIAETRYVLECVHEPNRFLTNDSVLGVDSQLYWDSIDGENLMAFTARTLAEDAEAFVNWNRNKPKLVTIATFRVTFTYQRVQGL